MAGTIIPFLTKNKEILIHSSDFVSFLLVTPEISKFLSGGLAKKWKYVGAGFLSIMLCGTIILSVVFFVRGETTLASILAIAAVMYAIFAPGMIREYWNLFTEETVPITQDFLRKLMFFWGFILFGVSRAVGILIGVIETQYPHFGH